MQNVLGKTGKQGNDNAEPQQVNKNYKKNYKYSFRCIFAQYPLIKSGE